MLGLGVLQVDSAVTQSQHLFNLSSYVINHQVPGQEQWVQQQDCRITPVKDLSSAIYMRLTLSGTFSSTYFNQNRSCYLRCFCVVFYKKKQFL